MPSLLMGSCFYVAPSEIVRAWFYRLNRSHEILVNRCWSNRLIHDAVHRGLSAEWKRTWEYSDYGEALRLIFPQVTNTWVPFESLSRMRCTLMACFLTSHCHFGSFSLSWHEDEASEVCPLCGDLLTRHHIFLQCPQLSMSRLFLFESAPCGHEMDLSWYVCAG